MPTAMLKTLYKLNDKKKNNQLVEVINSRLRDFKEEIEDMNEKQKNLKNHIKQQILLKKSLNRKNLMNKNKNKKDMA